LASTALSLAPPTAVAPSLDVAGAYREHYAFLWRLVRHLGVPAPAADDAVQDVFVVVSRRADDYRVGSSLRAWLTTIARYVVRDHRKSWRRRVRRLRAIGDAWSGRTDDGEIARADAARLVRALLESLPEDQRLVLVLSDLEGWTAPEIAEALELPVNTVYSRLRGARQKLEAVAAKGGEVRDG
jgi:RNA polymerase sigma-70 factor (ECF subfamily)